MEDKAKTEAQKRADPAMLIMIVVISLSLIMVLSPAPDGLSGAGQKVIGIAIIAIGLWGTEVLPVGVTAILVVIALMVSSHLTLICPPVPSLSQAPPPLYSHFLRARTHIPPRTGSLTLTAEGSAVEWVGSKGSEEEGSDRCMRPL